MDRYVIGVAPLTAVKLDGGRRANVPARALVPADADPADVARLIDEGYLAEWEPDLDDDTVEEGEGFDIEEVLGWLESGNMAAFTSFVLELEVEEVIDVASDSPELVAALLEVETSDAGQNRAELVEYLKALIEEEGAAPLGQVDVAELLKGTVDQVLDAVGDDAVLAARVLEAEQGSDKPRKGVVDGLQEAIAAAEVGS